MLLLRPVDAHARVVMSAYQLCAKLTARHSGQHSRFQIEVDTGYWGLSFYLDKYLLRYLTTLQVSGQSCS